MVAILHETCDASPVCLAEIKPSLRQTEPSQFLRVESARRVGNSWMQLLTAAVIGAAVALAVCKIPGGALIDMGREELQGCIFVGHVAADLDSVAAAVAGAELYGGTAALPSALNSESKWALKYWNATMPGQIVDAIADMETRSEHVCVCLVDFQQTTQQHAAIKPSYVVGVIDHHALQSKTIVTTQPIFVDIRPWGSTCTMLAQHFASHGVSPSRATAGLMLSAILSDTLNLRSPKQARS